MNIHNRNRQLALLAALGEAGFNRRVWIDNDPTIPQAQLSTLAKQFSQNHPYDVYIIAQLGEAEIQQKQSSRMRGWLRNLLGS